MVDGPLSDPCILNAIEIILQELGSDLATPDLFARMPAETIAFAYLAVSLYRLPWPSKS